MRRWLRCRIVLVLAAATLAAPAVGGAVQSFDLPVRGGELPASLRVVRVQKGDSIVLRFTSDAPLTIHLHGYDVERRLSPEAPATMELQAVATGRFPIEVHGSSHHHHVLGHLEVHPR